MDVEAHSTSPINRVGAAAQNALEVARFGGLETGEEAVAVRGRRRAADLPAAALLPAARTPTRRFCSCPPMMLAAEVYDVSPARPRSARCTRTASIPGWSTSARPSARRAARAHADRPRAPSPTRSTACARSPAATCTSAATRRAGCSPTRRRLRRGEAIASRDHLRQPGRHARRRCPFGIPEEVAVARRRACSPTRRSPQRGCRPGVSRTGFRLLDPVKSLRQQRRLRPPAPRPRGAAAARAPAPLPGGEGWVAWPGPALADFMHAVRRPQPDARGRLRDRRPPGDARRHRLPDPRLRRRGRRDRPAARGARDRRAAPRAEVFEVALRAGHFGLVVGSAAIAHDLADGRRVDALARRGERRAARARSPPVDGRRRARRAPGAGARRRLRARAGGGRRLALARTSSPASRRTARRACARRGGVRPAPAPRPPGPDPAAHPDLARPAARRAGRRRARGRLLPVRGPRAHARRRQGRIDNDRPRPDLGRRPPGRARRRADGDAAQRAHRGRRAQPPGRGRGAAAPDGDVAREAELGEIGGWSPTPSTPPGAARPASRCWCSAAAAKPRDLGRGTSSTWSGSTRTRSSCPAWYKPNPGPGARPRVRPLHGRGRAHPRQTGSRTGAGRSRRSAPPRRRR